MSVFKKSLFALATFLGTVLFLELMLVLLAQVSSKVGSVLGSTPATIADERLGIRPNPALFGHDRNGFRNPGVPERVDIVALGDSQTYGTGVLPGQAWPRQLASLTRRSTYGMAFGGYGPVHSLILMHDAVELRPALIIEGFYAGNDLYDAFKQVYLEGRRPDLRSADPDTLETLRRREEADPITVRIERLFSGGAKRTFSPLSFALEHSMLVGLIDAVVVEIGDWLRGTPVLRSLMNAYEWKRYSRPSDPGTSESMTFDDGRIKTVFALEYRTVGMNLDDPRIAEGLRICLDSIRRMNEIASDRGIEFRVLLIPTKALVFNEIVAIPSPAFRSFVANEEEIWRRSTRFFEAEGIQFIDALAGLRAELAAGTQPYPMSDGGHPNREGQAAIARLVADRLSK